MLLHARTLGFAGLLVALGCTEDVTSGTGGAGGAGGAPSASGLPCDVQEILEQRCQSCHSASPKFGAPMPLVTRADLLAAPVANSAATVGEATVARVSDTASPMPPPPSLPLDAAELAVLEPIFICASALKLPATLLATSPPSRPRSTTRRSSTTSCFCSLPSR